MRRWKSWKSRSPAENTPEHRETLTRRRDTISLKLYEKRDKKNKEKKEELAGNPIHNPDGSHELRWGAWRPRKKQGRLKGKQASQCLMEASRRPLAASSSFAASSRRCRWQSRLPVEAVDTSFIFHPSSCWSTFSTSHLLPPSTATLGGAILATPTLLFSSAALSALLGSPLFGLVRSPASPCPHLPPCLASNSLTWNNVWLSRSFLRSSSAFSLFLSFSASILSVSSPRTASRLPSLLQPRPRTVFPCVLSCVPGIVGNYSAQPAIPFSPFLLASLRLCFRLFYVAPFQRRHQRPKDRWSRIVEVVARDEYLSIAAAFPSAFPAVDDIELR